MMAKTPEKRRYIGTEGMRHEDRKGEARSYLSFHHDNNDNDELTGDVEHKATLHVSRSLFKVRVM